MSKREDYEKKTIELLEPIVQSFGVRIYDVEYVKEGREYYLRAYIDKEGGVNINDCENVSRALSDALDEADFIPDAYIMEVSSPGLGRALKKDSHLSMSLGESIDIHFYKALDGKKEISGFLKGFDKESIVIVLPDAEGQPSQEELSLSRRDISSINLTLDL